MSMASSDFSFFSPEDNPKPSYGFSFCLRFSLRNRRVTKSTTMIQGGKRALRVHGGLEFGYLPVRVLYTPSYARMPFAHTHANTIDQNSRKRHTDTHPASPCPKKASKQTDPWLRLVRSCRRPQGLNLRVPRSMHTTEDNTEDKARNTNKKNKPKIHTRTADEKKTNRGHGNMQMLTRQSPKTICLSQEAARLVLKVVKTDRRHDDEGNP